MWSPSTRGEKKLPLGGEGRGRGSFRFEHHLDGTTMAELPHLGTRCAHAECRQLDFLPFTCDACQQVYCLEHRTYRAHGCQVGPVKDERVTVCPACQLPIPMHGSRADVDAAWERHLLSGECERAQKGRMPPKKRCGAPGCGEKLMLSNTFVCKACSVPVCLKHRFGPDHACVGLRGKHHGRENSRKKHSNRKNAGRGSEMRRKQASANVTGRQTQATGDPVDGSGFCVSCTRFFTKVKQLFNNSDTTDPKR